MVVRRSFDRMNGAWQVIPCVVEAPPKIVSGGIAISCGQNFWAFLQVLCSFHCRSLWILIRTSLPCERFLLFVFNAHLKCEVPSF